MTVCLQIAQADDAQRSAGPSSPSTQAIDDVVKVLTRARRILVVTGAGISVHAGIPDFRSPTGLFKSLKRDNPREGLSSGKDLFDASVFGSEQTSAIFYQMIAKLSELSVNAEPTPFHSLLRTLDQRGQLLRMYTQNIDALEEKAGLSFGVPSCLDKPRNKRPRLDDGALADTFPAKHELPKCVPLHGTLQHMHCTRCSYSEPITPYIETLHGGAAPLCPSCTSIEETRGLVGKRPRGVGRLRPSVVLYGEEHREGERVGAVVQRDLTGKGKGNRCADLLIVAGTSLRVPGTKRIVREFAKSVKSSQNSTKGARSTDSPAPTPRFSTDPTPEEDKQPIRTIFINYEFPSPRSEWEGVFDVWVKGDAQVFAETVIDALRVRDERLAKRRLRASNPGKTLRDPTTGLMTPSMTPKKKRKQLDDSSPCPEGKQKRKEARRQRSVSPSPASGVSTSRKNSECQSSDSFEVEEEFLDLDDPSEVFPYPMRSLPLHTSRMTSSVRSTAPPDHEDSEIEVDEALCPDEFRLPSTPTFGFRRARMPSPPPSPRTQVTSAFGRNLELAHLKLLESKFS